MTKYYYPCIMLLNDIHISKENIEEFKLNWAEALYICDSMSINMIAVGGDLFMSRSSQTLDILLAVHDALLDAEKRNITIFLINGNHDKVNQESEKGYCHIFDQHKNVYVGDENIIVTDDKHWNFALHILAYFPENGTFTERLKRLKKTTMVEGKKNYLYVHEGINGAIQAASDSELPASLFESFDKVFVGHYHNRCIIPNTNIEYIGSSRQHNFGEDEEKGYTVLFNDGTTKFIKNEVNKRYKVIDVVADKVNVHLHNLIEELKEDDRNKIKVRITCPSDKATSIDKNKLVQAGATKVEIITEDIEIKEIVSSSLFVKYDGRKIQENYQEFCREKNIKDISLGLNYLSKIVSTCGN